MVVIVLILLSLGVAMFIMLSDTRKNDNFKRLDQGGDGGGTVAADAGGSADCGGDGGGGGCD